MSIQSNLGQGKENELFRVKYIDYKSGEEDIIKTLNDLGSIGSKFSKTSEYLKNENFPWYRGDVTELIDNGKSKVSSNRLFVSCETIVPMVTAKPAKPAVKDLKTAKSDAEGMLLEKLHQKVLTGMYKEMKLKKELQKLIRQWFIYRIAFLKYGIDGDGKICIKNVLPENLIIDPYSLSIEEASFVGEKIKVSVKDLADKYPKSSDYLYNFVGGKEFGFTLLEIKEYWIEDSFFVLHNDRELLYKGKNPLYDYSGIKEGDDLKLDRNYFKYPKKPYLAFRVYEFGDELRDFTSMLEQAIPLQKNYNDRLRQIDDNANITANPLLKGVGISSDELDDLNNRRKVGDAIPLEPGQDLGYTQPPSLPAYIINSVQLLVSEIDNIMSTQNTVRGDSSGSETATGRQILAQASNDRHGGSLGTAVDDMFSELYRAMTHLINVFYEVKDLVPYLGETDSKKYFKYLRDSENDGLQIDVVAGSTLPDDKMYQRAEAIELLGAGKITDEELYTRLGWDEPKESAKKLKLEGLEAQKLAEESQMRTAKGQQAIQNGGEGKADLMNKIQQLGQK